MGQIQRNLGNLFRELTFNAKSKPYKLQCKNNVNGIPYYNVQ